jgi:hypothetical protein
MNFMRKRRGWSSGQREYSDLLALIQAFMMEYEMLGSAFVAP